MNFEIPPSQKDQTLPMILVLRGDEAIIDDFSYDADQAMEFLGIKRSRLTQISGRELRVARIRRDRYIRPVYREADLRDYMDWTRATATHVSSSKAIEQAVESLDDRFNDVLVVLQERLRQQADEDQIWLKAELNRLLRSLVDIQTLREAPAKPGVQSDWILRKLNEILQRIDEAAVRGENGFREVGAKIDFFLPEIRELHAAQKLLRRDIDDVMQAFKRIVDLWMEEAKRESQLQTKRGDELLENIGELRSALTKPKLPRRQPTRANLRNYWVR